MDYKKELLTVDLAITRISGSSSNWSAAKGHNASEISIMFVLMSKETVTQKDICNMTAMPKQTVNNIIRDWRANDFIELLPHPKDKRAKSIALTAKGEEYVNISLQPVLDMQAGVIDAMGKERFLEFSAMLDEYYKVLIELMIKNVEED